MNKHAIVSIIKKELQAYRNSPTSYIIIIVFVGLWQFLFFRNAFLVGEATLRELFDLIPWLFMIFVPAITMASIAEEKNSGTLEFLLTHPVSNVELLIGKYSASLIFAIISLLFTLPIAIGFSMYGDFDWGVYVGQLLGSFAVASVFVSLGIFISSLVKSQIAALLLSAAVSFVLVIGGSEFVTASLPRIAGLALEQLSVTTHFNATMRGVLDIGDLWYYLSVTGIFLALTYLQLLKRQFGNKKQEYRRYQLGVILLGVIVILTNILGTRLPGRLDLTQEKLFTLTDATKDTLSALNDVVSITVYRSGELPAQFQPILRDVTDLLRDYVSSSNNNITVSYKDPSGDAEVAQEASSAGIQQVQFNVIGDEELQLKNGYLGLTVSYLDQVEVIPFIETTNDLEYQLTSFIKKLTTTEKKKIGFIAGNGEKTHEDDYQLLGMELENQFVLENVTFDETNSTIPEDIEVLVIAGANTALSEAKLTAINQYIDSGKSLLILHDSLQANTQTLSADANESNLQEVLTNLGVTVNSSIAYDLRSNETVSFGGGSFNVLLPYPFWIISQSTGTSTLSSRIDQVMLPWPNSISLDDSKIAGLGYTSQVLITTTNTGGTQSDSINLSPEQNFLSENLSQLPLAVSLTKIQSTGSDKQARIIVVGDSDFLSNNFVQNSPQNLAFGIESISWLAAEQSLAEIQVKQKVARNLVFENPTQQSMVRFVTLAIGIGIPLLFGGYTLQRRRMLRSMKYSKLS